MVDSAITRERRRLDTAHRITVCSQRLCEERGYDGFTMDDLAELAGVSRRTLFNYYPSKLDATLGTVPEIAGEALAVFREGGPDGDLLTDLGALASHLMSSAQFSRDEAALSQRVMMAEPRLMAAAHDRFQKVTEDFVDEIRLREGRRFDEDRARLAVRLLGAVFDHTFEQFVVDADDRPLEDLFTASISTARAIFG